MRRKVWRGTGEHPACRGQLGQSSPTSAPAGLCWAGWLGLWTGVLTLLSTMLSKGGQSKASPGLKLVLEAEGSREVWVRNWLQVAAGLWNLLSSGLEIKELSRSVHLGGVIWKGGGVHIQNFFSC